MARPVYTKQLLCVHNLPTDLPLTTSAGYTTVIRDVSWYADNSTVTSNYYFIYVVTAGGNATIVWFTVGADTTVYFHQECRLVLPAGTTWGVHSDEPSDLIVSGYELALP